MSQGKIEEDVSEIKTLWLRYFLEWYEGTTKTLLRVDIAMSIAIIATFESRTGLGKEEIMENI